MKTNRAHGPPAEGKRFYTLAERPDGRLDVFLDAKVYREKTEDGATDYDVSIRMVRSIDPKDFQPDLETHIRKNWDAWKEMAEVIWL